MKTNVYYFITLIAIFLILSGITYAQDNLIKNPSFEKLGADGNPENWRTHGWIKDEAVTSFSIDDKISHSGNKSVIVNNKQMNHGYYIQTVTVKKNSFYKVAGWVKTENVGEDVEGAGISVIDYFEVGGDFRGTNNWKLAELYVSAGQDTTFVEIQLQVGNYGAENSGKAWFDDISMVKIDSLPPGVKVTVMGKKEDVSQSGAEQDQKDTVKEEKTSGTFALLIIIIIIVIVVGIAVVILIILTRKKPGSTDENADTGEPGGNA